MLIASLHRGWSGDAMVLGKLPVPGRPTILMIVGHFQYRGVLQF